MTQLTAENKQFENSKPKGLSNAIETHKEKGEQENNEKEEKEKGRDFDKQAVDHQIKGQYRYHFTETCSGSEAGSYLRLIDLCITQL